MLFKFILDEICGAAEKVFNQLPTAETKGTYINLKQFASERFLQFVHWLRAQY